MDGQDLAVLVETGELLYVFFFLPKSPRSDGPLSRRTKVILRSSNTCEGRAKAHLTQMFIVSVHCLWAYDYLLTLGDEVRCPLILLPGVGF